MKSLTKQCLDFCQALASKSHAFTFTLTLGSTFSFSLDSKETTALVVPRQKKKASPSTLRRNMMRKQNFLAQKEISEKETDSITDSETSSQEQNSFKCNLCDQTFRTSNGLKIRKGKSHKD